jgi:hypothetical protein
MLADPVKKSAAAVEGEGAATFFISIIIITIVLGLIFYPGQVVLIFQGVLRSFGAPFVAFLYGVYNLMLGLVYDVLHFFTNGISNGLKSIGLAMGAAP